MHAIGRGAVDVTEPIGGALHVQRRMQRQRVGLGAVVEFRRNHLHIGHVAQRLIQRNNALRLVTVVIAQQDFHGEQSGKQREKAEKSVEKQLNGQAKRATCHRTAIVKNLTVHGGPANHPLPLASLKWTDRLVSDTPARLMRVGAPHQKCLASRCGHFQTRCAAALARGLARRLPAGFGCFHRAVAPA